MLNNNVFKSPWTGDPWPDVRTAVGVAIGLANYLNEKRPRRKPPKDHDSIIASATDAAGTFAGIPKLTRNGLEGVVISDAYWKAKETKQKLTAVVDDFFLQHQVEWGCDWLRDARHGAISKFDRARVFNVAPSLRAGRLAYWAMALTEKAASGNAEAVLEAVPRSYYSRTYANTVVDGIVTEMTDAGIQRETLANVERVWRFVVAAGRLPRVPDDDDLLAAFEAAIQVGECEFANELVRS